MENLPRISHPVPFRVKDFLDGNVTFNQMDIIPFPPRDLYFFSFVLSVLMFLNRRRLNEDDFFVSAEATRFPLCQEDTRSQVPSLSLFRHYPVVTLFPTTIENESVVSWIPGSIFQPLPTPFQSSHYTTTLFF